MSEQPEDDRLTRLLRATDAARQAAPLSPAEKARLYSGLGPVGSTRSRRWAWAIAATAGIVVLLLSLHGGRTPRRVDAPPLSVATPTGAPRPGATRELYFTAPHGTRIVWSLRNVPDVSSASVAKDRS